MTRHLDLREADRLRRAESRWLEQARDRLRRPAPRPPLRTPENPEPSRTEETDR